MGPVFVPGRAATPPLVERGTDVRLVPFSDQAPAISYQAVEPEVDARLDALERELAQLRGQALPGGACFPAAYGPDVNRSAGCRPDDFDMHYDIGAELTLLRPEIGSLVLHNVLQDDFRITPTYDLNAAYRFWIGQPCENGMGWRVAYWRFADSAKLDFPSNVSLSSKLNFYTVDFELTYQAAFCGWNLQSSMGVRIGGVDTAATISTTPAAGTLGQDYLGAGLTFALATKRSLGSTPWSVYGGFRGSLLYGVSEFHGDLTLDPSQFGQLPAGFPTSLRGYVADQTVAIWEMQLGLQYQHNTAYGTFVGRIGVESQLWQLPPVVLGLGSQSIGLFGPAMLVEFRH
jgi:hypothetical protein